jgi:hypothetical protein
MDSLTLIAIEPAKNKMQIWIIILVDRIFYDDKKAERKDGFPRLVVALAHELYGNVPHYLEETSEKMEEMTLAYRARVQVESYKTSVRFIEELRANPRFPELPESIRTGVLALLPREKEGLRSWQKTLEECGPALR